MSVSTVNQAARRIADASRPKEAADDPHRLARIYARNCEDNGRPLIWHSGEFLRYEAGAYRPVDDGEVRAELTRSIKTEFDTIAEVARLLGKQPQPQQQQEAATAGSNGSAKRPSEATPRKVTSGLVCDVRQALAGDLLIAGTVQPPAWLDGRNDGPDPSRLVVCHNGIIDLSAWREGRPHLIALDPALFSKSALPFDYQPDAGEPRLWLGFLQQLWPDDHQSVEALQEWFGYCLTPDTSLQKILLLVGPRRSGKGTVGRILTRLVGNANVCNPTLSSLASEFGLQPLLGKMLAIVSDARLSGRADAAVVAEQLLSISGEDGKTVNRKHLPQITVRLPLRFTILTNELPRLSDTSAALAGRMILLRLTQSWFGMEDRTLERRLLAELPGVLLWAMRGWKRLEERGYFITPESSAELSQDLDDLVSPIGVFIRERCHVEVGAEITRADLYGAYKSWCQGCGREPQTDQMFGRDLRAALPELGSAQRRAGVRMIRLYRGIRLIESPAGEP